MKTETNDLPTAGRKMRLGFVGGGQGGLIGEIHANGARLSRRWDITAGALSSDAQRARASGRAWMLAEERSYTDYREMARAESARSDGIDAVAIVTPNDLHAPVALAFMDAGINVLSDKPLALNLAEATALVARQQETGVVFGVAHAYTCHAMVRQARAMVARGMLGEIRQIHVEYFQEWATRLSGEGADVPWRLDARRGGAVFTTGDIGTHAENLASFVSGLRLEALRAEFHITGQPKALEDTAFMQLRFAGGVPGTLMVSQCFPGAHCGLRLRVVGTKASLDWQQETPEYLHFLPFEGPAQRLSRGAGAGMLPQAERYVRMPRGHPEGLSDAWANLYLEFAIAVEARARGMRLPEGLLAYPDIHAGFRGMQFCAAALRSHQLGQWVDIGAEAA
ncbi:MAG: Gfo/Idh/MocA family oxidoreductase [Rhodobacteraceae bacterium]|nr:Gfo/Idh/MocA family oxidoreductase [Paracoccaceae bacterium]